MVVQPENPHFEDIALYLDGGVQPRGIPTAKNDSDEARIVEENKYQTEMRFILPLPQSQPTQVEPDFEN